MIMDCSATYTDPIPGTKTRERVVRDGMLKVYQGVSSSEISRSSKLTSFSLITGALSTVASAGIAIAALAISF